MEILDKAFEELLDIMNLGMTLRQDQLNGSDLRSGREVLKEYLSNKLDTPKIIVVGIGQDLAMIKALELIKNKDLNVLVVDEAPRGLTINKVEEKTFTINKVDELLDYPIDYNADAKQGTNPRGRKNGNSKKRRKH